MEDRRQDAEARGCVKNTEEMKNNFIKFRIDGKIHYVDICAIEKIVIDGVECV